MKKIQLSAASISEHVKIIGEILGGKHAVDCDEINLKLDTSSGEGNIRGVNFQNGLGLLNIHCKLTEAVQLIYPSAAEPPMRFIFCVQGRLKHAPVMGEPPYSLEALKGSVTAGQAGKQQTLTLPAGMPLTINILEIIRKEYVEQVDCDLKSLPGPLVRVFRNTANDPVFIYTGNYSLSIAESIQEINYNNLTGLSRKAYLESKALEIFSYQVQQYEDDLKAEPHRKIFRKADAMIIAGARDILLEKLIDPPTISELAREVGLNEQKLKKGFKLLFNTTINKYLLHARMEHAKTLLAEGSKSIKEVAAASGFSNSGYFAARFKEKFGVLPSEFMKALRQEKTPPKISVAVA